MRHVERTNILIHVLDVSGMEGRDPKVDFDAINEDVLSRKGEPTRKIYYNIFLDDRAGLNSTYIALEKLYNKFEARGELKTWRE